jgi:hypothetical protein
MFYIFLLMFFALTGQIMLGNLGLFLPVTATMIFYITVCFGWQRGMLCSVVAGLALDVLYGISNLTPFIFLAVCGLAAFWLVYQQVRPASINFIPGMLTALITFFPQMLIKIYNNSFGIYIFNEWLPSMFFVISFCAILLPVIIVICDHFGKSLGLPVYVDAKHQLTIRK